MTKPSKPQTKPPRREDSPGHLDPAYAASLRALGGGKRDDGTAFLDDARSSEDLAEELGEQAVVAMTSGEDGLGDDLQADVIEEEGGPFVVTTARKELADDVDASNPEGANREPFPTTR